MELAKAKKIAEEKKREKLEERLARYMLGCSPLTFPRVHVHKYVTVALSKELIVLPGNMGSARVRGVPLPHIVDFA